jgi:hypothetical protein
MSNFSFDEAERIKNMKKLKYHKNLTLEHWSEFSFDEQMGNIGSEVGRIIIWRKKEDPKYSKMAFEKRLELLQLTIEDPKNKARLKKLNNLEKILKDYFYGNDKHGYTDETLDKYFLQYALAARINK